MKGRMQENWLAWPGLLYWAFLASSSFDKAEKRQQEPRGMLRQQERHRLVVMGVREDCS